MTIQPLSDNDLAQLVRSNLKRHGAATRQVIANVVRGVLVLSGQVVSFHHRQLCIAAGKQVHGIPKIDDQLDVIAPSPKPKRPTRTKTHRRLANQTPIGAT